MRREDGSSAGGALASYNCTQYAHTTQESKKLKSVARWGAVPVGAPPSRYHLGAERSMPPKSLTISQHSSPHFVEVLNLAILLMSKSEHHIRCRKSAGMRLIRSLFIRSLKILRVLENLNASFGANTEKQ